MSKKTTVERISKESIKNAFGAVIMFILFLCFYFFVAYPIQQWQCEQYGMQASHLVKGCVLKESK